MQLRNYKDGVLVPSGMNLCCLYTRFDDASIEQFRGPTSVLAHVTTKMRFSWRNCINDQTVVGRNLPWSRGCAECKGILNEALLLPARPVSRKPKDVRLFGQFHKP